MNTDSWIDRDIDALLAGRQPADRDLAALAPVVASLKATVARHAVSDAEARAFGAHLASTVTPAPAPAVARRSPWLRRASFAGIGALLLGASVAGAAAAADGSAPGDPLYSLDRALEHVGIGNGGLSERIAESQKLVDEGKTGEAVDHLADSLNQQGDTTSAQSLKDAAATILANGSATSADVHAAVAAMLQWMADNSQSATPLTGKDLGQHIAAMAQLIGSGHSQAPVTTGKPANPGKPDAVTTGKPANPGKPDSVTTGKPDSVTTGVPDSVTTGKPDVTSTGKPDTTGKP